jgi:hypothetical protein
MMMLTESAMVVAVLIGMAARSPGDQLPEPLMPGGQLGNLALILVPLIP